MNVKLVYFGSFENEFNGQKYNIVRFVSENLDILYGNNIEYKEELIEGNIYLCKIGIKRNKLVVQEIIKSYQ